jgi:ATP phosphoribosyltransferase regulatory subunit
LTLYPDAILRAAPPRQARLRVFIPFGSDRAVAAKLRAEGFATVAGLDVADDNVAEACRLGCSHILSGGKAALLDSKG